MGSGIAPSEAVVRRSAQLDAVSTLPTADRNTLTACDEFFFALDGQSFEANGETWTLDVCGVHAASRQQWVQLHLRGRVSQGLTVRVARLDAREVLSLVHDWLEGLLPAALETAVTGRAYLPVLTS
jgi:hypothetical protein